MNPLDNEEFPFIIKNINDNMPKISETSISIKHSFVNPIPKNLIEEAYNVNQKYLDNHLNEIEEIKYRSSYNKLPEWMRNYQNRYFSANLGKDGFFKKILPSGYTDDTRHMFDGNNFIQFGKILGTTVTAGGTTQTRSWGAPELRAVKTNSSVTINSYYDRFGIDVQIQSGNVKVGVYTDSSGATTLLSSTGSTACPANFSSLITLTEFQATTSFLWLAWTPDNTSMTTKAGSGAIYPGVSAENDSGYTSFASALPSTYSITSSGIDDAHLQLQHS